MKQNLTNSTDKTRLLRKELEPVWAVATTMPPEELPALIGDLEQIRVVAMARLIAPAPTFKPDELVGVEDAARRLGMSTGYLYRNHRQLSFARHIGRKLLFSSVGIDRFIAARR